MMFLSLLILLTNIQFEKVTTVSGDTPHYFFGNPTVAVFISESEFAVADAVSPVLRVFNINGDFVREYGSRGRGPGELIEASSIAFGNGKLVAYDRMQSKFVVFKEKTHKDILLTTGATITPAAFIFSTDSWYMVYREYTMDESGSQNLVHQWSSDLTEYQKGYFKMDDVFDMSDPFYQRFVGSPRTGYVNQIGNNLIFTPYLYDGLHLKYVIGYEEYKEFSVKSFSLEPYSIVRPGARAIRPALRMFGDTEPIEVNINRHSLGWITQDQKQIHLYAEVIDNAWVMNYELFDTESNIIASGNVEGFTVDSDVTTFFPVRILGSNNDGEIIVYNSHAEDPAIEIYRLK